MSTTDPVVPQTAPLAPERVASLNSLLKGLQADQLLWVEGFISGLRATFGAASQTTDAPLAVTELTVLYGTESGNSESLADLTVKAAQGKGFKAKAVNMADIKVAKLKDIQNLLVIVSTWGEGDPPETAIDFYEAFMGDKAPKLPNTRFSVLGLGDTSYEEFCKMGIDFDARLEGLGAKRIYDRVDCDVDYDDDFAKWHKGALGVFEAEVKPAASVAVTAPAATEARVKYSRKNPYSSELTERVMLNGEGSAKETIHLEFNLEGSGLEYETGDALAVVPHNAEDVVNAIIETTKLVADAPVRIKEQEYTLKEALTSQLDVTAISLPVLKRYNEIAKDTKLAAMLDPAKKTDLQAYLDGREIIDVLNDFPAKEITANALVGIMRKLPPRLYSIASSPKAHPGEVHLTVGVVRYDTHGRQRKGVCSTYLSDRIAEGDKADVFVTANKHFKIPADNDAPMIMVGPGTGIAPFRAFVEERKAIGAKGQNWLFFGDQHYLTDFLYQTEWQDYLADGFLTKLDVAFSRDQEKKVYVQDRMRENSAELFEWLEKGASFYVCGDASRMATDVDLALHEIIEKEGGKSNEDAVAYVKKLKTDKRYLRDVY
ncbi:MAG: assimilatory sulfite reductase (NADPH) flavoprotein subunit [Puniceicoccaceae bacterium]|nr:MAG: assimilatory sulfite reductase (NADPH) flavoprotein subunit [Puniceicoccaceae bacterium]